MDSIIDELTAIGITFLALHFKQPEDPVFKTQVIGGAHQHKILLKQSKGQ